MSTREMEARGWTEADIVFITGDAYIDHPSFAMAILGRVLEAAGFRVGIVSQPDWQSCEDWKRFGRPRLFFAISAGNMDSMINHYTANRKVRNDDAYSPGGRIGLRPDRATLAYCQRAREAYKGVPVIAGGVEASLRRLAHYDYWSDKVRRSILLDCKADLVCFGMGEEMIVEIAQRLDAGETVKNLRHLRGVAYALGAKEELPEWPPGGDSLSPTGDVRASEGQPRGGEREASLGIGQSSLLIGGEQAEAVKERAKDMPPHPGTLPPDNVETDNRKSPAGERGTVAPRTSQQFQPLGSSTIELPSFEQVARDKLAFAEATKIIHNETNPYNARRLVQYHDRQAVVCNPPALPISQPAMDAIYALPYTRKPHPSYTEPIPAYEMIKDSVTIMRGCFGGCTFCSITTHQGRIIQSRSKESVLGEIRQMTADPEFKGIISDIGGPTANMYEMVCSRPEVEAVCRRQSCVHPTICKLLGTDHGPLVQLMQEARETPGVRKVLVASGIRMDLARRSPEYMRELTQHHVGGLLKVAPEHTDPNVLNLMRKPSGDDFEQFAEIFEEESRKAGKTQHIVPYFIASHPGSDLHAMIDLAVFLKRNGYKPDQVQDFIPAPFDVATAMYYTEIDPFTKQPVQIARHLRDRKLQRALMQFFKPENYFEVRRALEQAGRTDLIGSGCDALIAAQPPREAIERRRQDATRRFHGEYVHRSSGTGVASEAGQGGHRDEDGDSTASRAGQRKKKGSRKQSRHEAGPGYRPDAKKSRRKK
ncbi:MAG: YgiQ family radical SAM protein [Planctomycetaceae bacterium]|nr:YgiQ family radical SAM protein [Planctomycetaceae bacterium]